MLYWVEDIDAIVVSNLPLRRRTKYLLWHQLRKWHFDLYSTARFGVRGWGGYEFFI